jgi:CheY-like chemotaxis protein
MALRGTILVAEDEGLARHSLTEILQEEGYQVYEAADGNSITCSNGPRSWAMENGLPPLTCRVVSNLTK